MDSGFICIYCQREIDEKDLENIDNDYFHINCGIRHSTEETK